MGRNRLKEIKDKILLYQKLDENYDLFVSVVNYVSAATEVSAGEIFSGLRNKEVLEARDLCIYICADLKVIDMDEICEVFGMNKKSCESSINRITEKMQDSEKVRRMVEKIESEKRLDKESLAYDKVQNAHEELMDSIHYIDYSRLQGKADEYEKMLKEIEKKAQDAYVKESYSSAAALYKEYFDKYNEIKIDIRHNDYFSRSFEWMETLLDLMELKIHCPNYNSSYREYSMSLAHMGRYADAVDFLTSNMPVPKSIEDIVWGKCAEFSMAIHDLCEMVLRWREENIQDEVVYTNGADLVSHKFSKELSEDFHKVAKRYYQALCDYGNKEDFKKNKLILNMLSVNKHYLKYHLSHYLRTGEEKSRLYVLNAMNGKAHGSK